MSLPLGDFPARAGFDDTSLHGSTQIPTPTLASLAKEGVLLMNYYVMPVCTPTRSAIHTGRHPIHTGMQGGALLGPKRPAGVGVGLCGILHRQRLGPLLELVRCHTKRCRKLGRGEPKLSPEHDCAD